MRIRLLCSATFLSTPLPIWYTCDMNYYCGAFASNICHFGRMPFIKVRLRPARWALYCQHAKALCTRICPTVSSPFHEAAN